MDLRVVIVDDNEAFLAAARALLETGSLLVVGTATNPQGAVEEVRRAGPDVVVVDLHLGSASGLDLARRLADEMADPPAVVLMSTIGYDDLAVLAADAPVRGCLTKTDLSAVALESILEGSAYSS
jgi:DNA-binding NarL/FixJ family response regulator